MLQIKPAKYKEYLDDNEAHQFSAKLRSKEDDTTTSLTDMLEMDSSMSFIDGSVRYDD